MVYRTTALRQDRDQALRQRILACALARVSAGGFASLTMQALAADCGIATGSLYRHFRSKGELASQVFAEASQREVQALAAAFAHDSVPAQRLAVGVGQFAERAWHSRQLAYALIAEPVDPEVDEQRLRFRQAYAELFTNLLNEGVACTDFKLQRAQLTAACLVGAIAEALVGPLSPAGAEQRTEEQFAEIRRNLITFCMRAVGAKEY
jgi:AcrR family transcriptional regulator